jgi:hypothetical protein
MSNVSQDIGHTSQQQQQRQQELAHLGLSIHQQQRQPSPHFSADFSVPPPPVASRPGFQTNLIIK